MTFDQKFEQTYVVVTDFNGWDQTQRCLQSLASSLPKQPHIIVVDHGTDGETSKQLHSCSGVSLVRGSSSDWWSGACNAGIEKALSLGAKYIVLLNNDCRVGQTTINSLLQSLHQTKRSDTTIIAAKQRVDGSSTDSPYLISTCLILGFNTLVLPQWLTRKSDKSETLVSVNMIIGAEVLLFQPVFLPRLACSITKNCFTTALTTIFFFDAERKEFGCIYILERLYLWIKRIHLLQLARIMHE